MIDWLKRLMSGKTKADRQFELLDERLIDVQGKVKNLHVVQREQFGTINKKLDAVIEQFANLALMKEEITIIHGLLVNGGTTPGDNGAVLTAINNLNGKVDKMSSNIDRIEKEAADLAEDVTIIKQAMTDLKTLVSDLQTQVAQGQVDQGRLDAAASKLEGIDNDLDSLTTQPEPTPTEGGGGVTP